MNTYFLSLIAALRGFAFSLMLLAPGLLYGHGDHEHGTVLGEGAAGVGPLTLPDETIKNLGILTVEAKLMPLQKSVTMAARIEPLPEKHALISPRFEGRVGEILVKLGDQVKIGQPLLRGEPLTVGSPAVVLKSPLEGRVTRQAATLGQSFNADTVLMEVSDQRQIYARGITYEGPELTNIQKGQPAKVKVNVLPEKVFAGKVEGVDVGLESQSKTFELFVLLENTELQLRPNMQATMTVGVGPAEEVLAVPKRAVLGDLGSYFIFVRDGNTFERRAVVLGLRAGDLVEVLEGVLPTDQVVTQGNYQLQFATVTPKAAAAVRTAAATHSVEDGAHAHTPLQRIEHIVIDRRLWIGVGALIAVLIIIRLLVGIFRSSAAPRPSLPSAQTPIAGTPESLAKH